MEVRFPIILLNTVSHVFYRKWEVPPAARGEDEAQGLSDEGMHAGGSGTNAPAPDSRLRSSQRPPVKPVFSPNHLVPR